MKKIAKIITFIILIVCVAFGGRALFTSCSKTKKTTAALDGKPPVAQIQASQKSELQPEMELNSSPLTKTSTKVESPRLAAIIKPANKSAIGFQSSGVITKINVKAGDNVKKDQILASLDNTIANFDMQNAQRDLESKHVVFNQVQKKYESYLTLFQTGALSKITLEDEENNFKIAKINFESAEINLKSKEYAFKLTELSAPYEGVISNSYKSLGDFVTPGTTVFDLVQTTDLSVFAQVPVAFFGQFKTGMIFSIINPLNGDTGNMTIQKIVPVIDTQSHTFDIYGKINEISHNFFPGMYVEIILK